MWFRNLSLYRLPADWNPNASHLEERLTRRALQPCGPFDLCSRGWVAASPAGRLVHTVNQQQLITLGVDQKLLPATVIRQEAARRATLIEQEQGYPPGRRQLRDLKLRVTEELRARALTRRRDTRAWIDPGNGWFVVDAAGGTRADEVVDTLRDTLDGFAVQLLQSEESPRAAMGKWLRLGTAPPRFTIDQDLQLCRADDSRAAIRYTRHPLDGRDIQARLEAGMYVAQLGLTWNDRIAFVLTEKLQIRRLEFLEMSHEDAAGDGLDPAEQFDIDFTVMTGELAQMLDDLVRALGVSTQQQAAAA